MFWNTNLHVQSGVHNKNVKEKECEAPTLLSVCTRELHVHVADIHVHVADIHVHVADIHVPFLAELLQ